MARTETMRRSIADEAIDALRARVSKKVSTFLAEVEIGTLLWSGVSSIVSSIRSGHLEKEERLERAARGEISRYPAIDFLKGLMFIGGAALLLTPKIATALGRGASNKKESVEPLGEWEGLAKN